MPSSASLSAYCRDLMTRVMALCAGLSLSLAMLSAFSTQVSASDALHYTQGTASRDGIGKFYLGREIAHVMGHRGADWLERVHDDLPWQHVMVFRRAADETTR